MIKNKSKKASEYKVAYMLCYKKLLIECQEKYNVGKNKCLPGQLLKAIALYKEQGKKFKVEKKNKKRFDYTKVLSCHYFYTIF